MSERVCVERRLASLLSWMVKACDCFSFLPCPRNLLFPLRGARCCVMVIHEPVRGVVAQCLIRDSRPSQSRRGGARLEASRRKAL